MCILRAVAICFFLAANIYAEGVPDDCTQLILGVAPNWNSMRGELRLFERPRGGQWTPVAGPFAVLFGKNGVAWGTGLLGQNEPGLQNRSEMVAHPPEVSKLARSLDTITNCLRA